VGYTLTVGMESQILETTCPPWALPREDIPIHVRLNKNITEKILKAIIELPECFELKDTINASEFKQFSNRIEITSIGKVAKSEWDYFGIVIATKEPFTELKKQIRIGIKLIFKDNTEQDFEVFARVFRPLLEIENIPEEIPITDNPRSEPVVPINLKFTGFGDISIRLESTIGGQIVSQGDSVLDEIFQRMMKEGLIKENMLDNKLGIKVNEDYIHRVLSDFKEKFRTSNQLEKMMNDNELAKEAAEMLLAYSDEEKEKFMTVFYKTIEGYLIKIVTDILNRNISNNLHVESSTSINTQIEVPITDVTLKIFYKDVIGNEYPSLEQKIKLHDKRKDPSKFHVNIPLEIKHVDDKNAYKNVGDMVIGSVT